MAWSSNLHKHNSLTSLLIKAVLSRAQQRVGAVLGILISAVVVDTKERFGNRSQCVGTCQKRDAFVVDCLHAISCDIWMLVKELTYDSCVPMD